MKLIWLITIIFMISGCICDPCKPKIKIITKYISVDKDIDRICPKLNKPNYKIYDKNDSQDEFDTKTVINLTIAEEYLKLYYKHIECIRKAIKSSGEDFETNSNK